MRLILWEITVKSPAGSTILIIEASRPSTALSRAGRYIEEAKRWQVPRIHQSGLSALWGYITLYRVSPAAITKGRMVAPHVWELGPDPEEVE